MLEQQALEQRGEVAAALEREPGGWLGSPAARGGDPEWAEEGHAARLDEGESVTPSALQQQIAAAEVEAAARQRRAEAARVEALLARSQQPVEFLPAQAPASAAVGTAGDDTTISSPAATLQDSLTSVDSLAADAADAAASLSSAVTAPAGDGVHSGE